MIFHKSDIELFQRIAETEIRIRKPIVLQVQKTVKLDSDWCIGLWEDEFDYHSIKISRAEIWNPVELFATIIHEYVHAWQSENNLPVNHSPSGYFHYWRKYFRRYYGVNIAGLNHA
jgi:hypothetical protein